MIFEIFLGIIIFTEGYVIWNLFRKTELLETWVEDFTQQIQTVQNNLKQIDSTGHFESDDEIGSVFEGIKLTIENLNTFVKGENVNG